MDQQNGVPLDTAAIVSTVLEGILYGISIMMFIWTVRALTHNRTRASVNTRMIMAACLMLVFSTAHMVIDIIRIHEGFVQYRSEGPINFFTDVSQWTFVYKNLVYTFQNLVGDAVVIYRCYVVWQSWWIIVFPFLLWVSVGVTGIGCIYFDSQATVHKDNVFAPSTGKWITAFLTISLVTNIISTSLLAFRIWKIGTRVTRLSSHTTVLRPVLRIILDAGVLYSITLLAALLCFVAKNRGHYVVIDMSVPIMSITFSMVIIRITLSTAASQGAVQPSTASGSGPILTLSRISRQRDRDHRTKRMEVHITQLTETNEAEEYMSRSVGSKQDGQEGEVDVAAKVLGSFAV